MALHLLTEPLETLFGLEPVPRCEPITYQPINWFTGSPDPEPEMFYLTTLSTHFIHANMASDIW